METHSSVLAWRIPGWGSLVGCHLWGRTESDTTEATQQQQQPLSLINRVLGLNPLKVKVKSLSLVRLFVTPLTVTYQAPLSMGFSRQEYWSGLPFPSPGELPNPGIEPGSPALQADALPSEPPGNKTLTHTIIQKKRNPRESNMDRNLQRESYECGTKTQILSFVYAVERNIHVQ